MVPGLYLFLVFCLGRLILVYHAPRWWPTPTASCLLFESDNGQFRIRLSLCSSRAGVPSRFPEGAARPGNPLHYPDQAGSGPRALRPYGGVDDGVSAPEPEADASREFALGGIALGCACLRVGLAGSGAEAGEIALAHDAAVRSGRTRPILQS